MDFIGGSKIKNLSKSNFHIRKQKIELVIAFCELSDQLKDRPTLSSPEDVRTWQKNDAKAGAVIGFSLSNEHLEHVHEVETASRMWLSIQNLFRRRTLLNRLSNRRRFYTMVRVISERVIQFNNCPKQLGTDLRAMDVDVHDQELAMKFCVDYRLISNTE